MNKNLQDSAKRGDQVPISGSEIEEDHGLSGPDKQTIKTLETILDTQKLTPDQELDIRRKIAAVGKAEDLVVSKELAQKLGEGITQQAKSDTLVSDDEFVNSLLNNHVMEDAPLMGKDQVLRNSEAENLEKLLGKMSGS